MLSSCLLQVNIPSTLREDILREFRSKVTNFDECCEPNSSVEPIVTGRVNREVGSHTVALARTFFADAIEAVVFCMYLNAFVGMQLLFTS